MDGIPVKLLQVVAIKKIGDAKKVISGLLLLLAELAKRVVVHIALGKRL